MMALNHQEPDRVPMELGSSEGSAVTQGFYHRLKAHFDIEAEDEIFDRMQMITKVDERILKELDVDVRGLWMGPPDNGGSVTLDDESFRDEWGTIYRRPPGSLYYDPAGFPLEGEITISDIVNYPWPDPHDPGRTRGLREEAERLRRETDCAILLNLPSICVVQAQCLRGFESWCLDVALDPKLAGALMDAIVDVTMAIAGDVLDEVGDIVDIAFTANDLGTQNGLLISPETYRCLIKPRQRRFLDSIKSKTSAKIAYHTCGSVYPILGDFIDIGIDILNPVQPMAKDMEPARLKREFGDRLSFWGAVDTQNVLPYGTVEDVKAEVERRIGELATGGGYLLTPSHNTRPDVSTENLLAVFSHGREIGTYPLNQIR